MPGYLCREYLPVTGKKLLDAICQYLSFILIFKFFQFSQNMNRPVTNLVSDAVTLAKLVITVGFTRFLVFLIGSFQKHAANIQKENGKCKFVLYFLGLQKAIKFYISIYQIYNILKIRKITEFWLFSG